jgi:hypothetical protein
MLMPSGIGSYHQKFIDRYLSSGEVAHGRAVGQNRKVCIPEYEPSLMKSNSCQSTILASQLEGVRKSGERFLMSLSLSEALQPHGGDLRYFVGFIRDLTEQEKLVEVCILCTVSRNSRCQLMTRP